MKFDQSALRELGGPLPRHDRIPLRRKGRAAWRAVVEVGPGLAGWKRQRQESCPAVCFQRWDRRHRCQCGSGRADEARPCLLGQMLCQCDSANSMERSVVKSVAGSSGNRAYLPLPKQWFTNRHKMCWFLFFLSLCFGLSVVIILRSSVLCSCLEPWSQFEETAISGIESSGVCTLLSQKFRGRQAFEVGAQKFMQHKVSKNYLIQPYSSRSNCERVDR